ncbi:MAG: hypothetical protein DI592_18325 [Stenotrophomonas maltophilia]|nr:MAG: hypothetical protein DI592_18325 [Stenotrophomonas maltophilia]
MIDSAAESFSVSSAGAPVAVLPRSKVVSTCWFISMPGGKAAAAAACAMASSLPRLIAATLTPSWRAP